MLCAAVAFAVIFSAVAFAQGGPPMGQESSCSAYYCVMDAFNTSGNHTVQICAGTPAPVSSFNIWYDGMARNISNGGVVLARFTNTTAYTYRMFTSTSPCVDYILNESFTNRTIQINVTAFNLTNFVQASQTCVASGCNGTMITANYIAIEAQNAGGTGLPNVLMFRYNNGTKVSLSMPALTDNSSGFWAEHCAGEVVNLNCVNRTTGETANTCYTHGSGFSGAGTSCALNATNGTLRFFDFITTNSTTMNFTPGTPVQARLSTLNTVGFVEPFTFSTSPGPPDRLNLTNVTIADQRTGERVHFFDRGATVGEMGPGGGGPPFFLSPNTVYNITAFVQNRGFFYYTYMSPSSGITGVDMMVPVTSATYTTFQGRVVNESGTAMPGTLVYAQMYKGGGGHFGIVFVNSSVTDANGLFTLRVPTTRFLSGFGFTFPFPVYQFYLVNNQTNSTNSVPIYFPTVDSNGNRGFFAQPAGGNVILPPLTIKQGGQVNINVTLNSAAIVMTELNKFLNLGTGTTRSDSTSKFTMISIFQGVTAPSTATVSMLSPVGSVRITSYGRTDAFGDFSGSSTLSKACFGSATVAQGLTTAINCNLTTPGTLRFGTNTFNNIFEFTGQTVEQAGSFHFWFEQVGIIRDSAGNAVAYVSGDGSVVQEVLGFGQNLANTIDLPLPDGNYTFELAPGFDFSRYTRSSNKTNITIVSGQTTRFNLTRGLAFDIEPRFNPSMIFSGSNSINISVKLSGSALNSTNHVALNGTKVLYLNKSVAANQDIQFVFDPVSGGGIFYNNTFNPSQLGLSAGKYLLSINATNQTATGVHTTTFLMPINAYDFQVWADMGGFSFSPGQIVSGKIYVYNSTSFPPVGFNSTNAGTAQNITVKMYDTSGLEITNFTFTPSNLTNGEGTFNLTLPLSLGFYEVVTSVTSDKCLGAPACRNGTSGVADNWLEISNMGIKATTDRSRYRASDTVILTVQVLNGTNNGGIANAGVEVTVDNENTPASGATDSDGKAVISVDPGTYSSSGSWSYGFHTLKVKVSKSSANEILKSESFLGFDVRGFDAIVQPDKQVYSTSDNVLINIMVPADVENTIQLITAVLDGNSSDTYTAAKIGPGYWRLTLGAKHVGRHNLKITVLTSSGTQVLHTGFGVSTYNIIATTDKFSYNQSTNASLLVKVSLTNGTAVASQNVVATLYKAQPPNDINISQAAGNTNASGQVTLNLTLLQSGFNYIKINVSNQFQFVGVQVSNISVILRSGVGGAAVNNYDVSPGGNAAITVSASSGASNIADGSAISAKIFAFGNVFNLPSNTTTLGNGTIYFQVPADAPAQKYGLEVTVTTPTGDVGSVTGTLTVSGGSAMKLSVSTNRGIRVPYIRGEAIIYTAMLKYPNGTAAGAGHNISFEFGSESTRPVASGTAMTNANGVAAIGSPIPATDGVYYIHAYITNNTAVQAYDGFTVFSLLVDIVTDKTNYSAGENITINITVTNKTSGTQINATDGYVSVFNKERGVIQQTVTTTGLAQPYRINITVPNESSAVGRYPIAAFMNVNASQGAGIGIVKVLNTSVGTIPLNITLPSSVAAGNWFLVNISAGATGTASLRIGSPAAEALVYDNTSVTILTAGSGTPNVSINITNITVPGVYIFDVSMQGVGSASKVFVIAPPTSGTIQAIWTGAGVVSRTNNATSFSLASGADIYIMSNVANTTARVMTVNSTTNATVSYTIPLSLNSSTTYYGIMANSNLVSGNAYFVRLDGTSATGIAATLFRVST